jgi:hypothetical protein
MTQNNPVLALSPRERAELFNMTAEKMLLPTVLIEKDFWVCWTLEQLFAFPNAREHFIFKGGTSLSKVWKAIERFSEDIDISMSREWLGFGGDNDPEKIAGRKKREEALDELHATCAAKLRSETMPELANRFREQLGADGWSLELDPTDDQTLLFSYPSAMEKAPKDDYTRRVVKIECGARSDRWPVEMGRITSYVAEQFPKASAGTALEIPVLSIERTFWEKATILHAEAHRQESETVRTRFSRHYADLAALSKLEAGRQAIIRDDLMERVVAHKKVYFAAKWNKMEEAVRGTFRLIPSEKHLKELEADYSAMRQMYFKEPPPWSEIVETLRALEAEINKASTTSK